MKKTSLLFVSLCFSLLSFSQNVKETLVNSYTAEEIESIESNDPEKYEMLVYALDHATYLGQYNEEKHGSLQKIDVSIENPRFTDLGVKIEKVNQYFYAPALNKVVVVKSEWVLSEEMKKR